MDKLLPSTVADKPTNMDHVAWPEEIRGWVDNLVAAWFRNGCMRDENRALTDHIYWSYWRCNRRGRRLNTNEIRFMRQCWSEAVSRHEAVKVV